MRKTEEKKQTFRNGKELLERCIHRLNEDQRGEAGGNVALYPVVIVMLGEKSSAYVKYIKNTLDDNWNNARFLRYIKVVKQGAHYIGTLIDDTKNYEECQWRSDGEDFEEAINKAVVSMLEADEKIFQNRTSVKMEYILDATEEFGEEYFELFRITSSQLHVNELKTLYLMLDQRPAEKRAEASDELLQYIKETKGSEAGTIYLLSNYLKSGRMLGEKYIFENYRLIADIILLGGNRGGAAVFKENLYGGIKTVSYALVTKPTDEIAAVALKSLLRQIYEEDKSNFTHEMTEQEIRERLKIDSCNGIELAEKIFREKVENSFPSPDCFRYLPFRSAKEGREASEDDAITIKALDAVSYGAASAFVKMYYEEPAEKLFDNEDNISEYRMQIRQSLQTSFEFFELVGLDKRRDLLKSLIDAEYHSGGNSSRGDFAVNLHNRARYESKKLFYEKIKQLYIEEIEELLDAVTELSAIYAECEKEIQREWIVTGDESESVEKIYTKLVREYVRSQKKVNERKTAFPRIFNSNNDKEALLQAFWEAFCSMIKIKEFSYDFEQEVDFRMDNMNEAGRYRFVSRELEKKLDESVRLKNSIDVETIRMGCYYLINESADYARNLKQSDKNGKEYTLFALNRTDCIEQLEIYNITKPELLKLTREDEE